MRILLLCNSDLLAMPAAIALRNRGELVAVGITEKSSKILMPALASIGIEGDSIHVLTRKNIESDLTRIITENEIDVVFVMTFSWKIPASVLTLPKKGCINFHFGLLPEYKGTDPVFWQLKNMEQKGGISIHVMTDEIDAGPVVLIDELPVIPGETYGIHCQRLGALNVNTTRKVLTLLEKDEVLPVIESDQSGTYCKAPTEQELTIHWKTQTADDIEWLINATNPRYGGATTNIRQMQVRILEVSPATVNIDPNNTQEIIPGTIVYADQVYGLIVACRDKQFLKVNIVSMQEGYLSGIKLFSLGFKPGEVFY
ncbi:formyltransferase family protein [Danxiaibacter flavus]|uniref:Formyltransferase family protein n=1 Tax=Danxiaibacter flavus TaxID=3049108 RepID=A0ABV3ZG15_9BACT|nr:formyltransferase family protein [Chitinophagaceae bacterium DXS]